MGNAMTDVDNALPYVSSSTPASPVAGLTWYNPSTDLTQIYDGTTWQAVSVPLFGAFTPTWTASSVNPTLGNGTLNGRYFQLAPKAIFVRIDLAIGSTTSGGGGTYSFALPVAAASDFEQFIGFRVANANNFVGFGYIPVSSTTVRPFATYTNGSATASAVSGGAPALSAGSSMSFWGIYETA